MWLRKFLIMAGAVATLAMSCTSVAMAAQGWQSPLEGARVLGFGATYRADDGSTNVHGGLDIAGSSGERVRACASGEVVFAGKVPAGEGAQAFAVTILTSDGLRVTLLPLSAVKVSAGSGVQPGDTVGSLAQAGDASSGTTHLHLGVKRGSTRLDPASFLAEVPPAPEASAPSAGPGHASAPRAAGAPTASRPRLSAGPASVAGPAAPPVEVGTSAPAVTFDRVHVSAQDVLASAAGVAATALEAAPRLRRIPTLRTTRVLSVSRMWRDITDLRGALGKGMLVSVLALVAAACVLTAVRTAGATAQQAGAALAPVREERS